MFERKSSAWICKMQKRFLGLTVKTTLRYSKKTFKTLSEVVEYLERTNKGWKVVGASISTNEKIEKWIDANAHRGWIGKVHNPDTGKTAPVVYWGKHLSPMHAIRHFEDTCSEYDVVKLTPATKEQVFALCGDAINPFYMFQ